MRRYETATNPHITALMGGKQTVEVRFCWGLEVTT
jgi:hypothetical protein